MDNDAYTRIETPFREAARPLLNELRASLISRGFGPLTEVHEIDRDIERGLGFECADNPDQFVDLMLTDNDAHGDVGVGLILTCSIYASGQAWAPGNFTDDFAMTTEEEVTSRLLRQFDAGEICERVAGEWARMAAMQERPSSMRCS